MSIFDNESEKYIKNIDLCINNYNKLIKKDITLKELCKGIDYLIIACSYIEKAQIFYLKYSKPNSRNIDSIKNFDYNISIYANIVYIALNKTIIPFCTKLDVETEYGKIYGQKTTLYEDMNKSKFKMLYISARWNCERFVDIWDITRQEKKKKLPRRLSLLIDVIACFNRIIAIKMGIVFDDGFNINRLVLCLPPSGGKTFFANVYSILMLALHYIYYRETGIIRMTNTAPKAKDYGEQVSGMMKNKIRLICNNKEEVVYPFLEVFPEFKKICKSIDGGNNNCTYDTKSLFSRDSSEKILISNCLSECSDSIFMFGRDSSINGIRAQLGTTCDDLSDGIDTADNDELHMKITDKIKSDVSDRSDDDDCPIILMGTMYNEHDYQNTYIDEWEAEGLIQHPVHKNVRYTMDGKKAICLVDIEDEEGNSVAPLLYSNEKLKNKRTYYINRGKAHIFNLLYKQKRDSREPKTFGHEFLQTYDKIPEDLNKESFSMIDPTRKSGGDYFAMPFLQYREADGLYYLTDIIFQQKCLGSDYDAKNVFAREVCRKLIDRMTIECRIESNTGATTTNLLAQICKELGSKVCKFKNAYTVGKGKGSTKITRILEHEESIKNNIVFPSPKAIHDAEMFQFIKLLTNWNSKGGQKKGNPDDAPDVLALFDENFIHKKSSMGKLMQVPKGFMRC